MAEVEIEKRFRSLQHGLKNVSILEKTSPEDRPSMFVQLERERQEVLKKENVEFPAGRIESKDVDLTIKLDKAYQNLENYKSLPLKRAKDGSVITLNDVARVELGAE